MGKPAVTMADRAGIFFQPSRVRAKLQKKKTWKAISKDAPIYLAAGVERIATGILRKAAENVAAQKLAEKKGSSDKPPQGRIDMADIVRAVRENVDYARFFSGFAFSSAHSVPKASKLVTVPKKDKDKDKAKGAAPKAGGKK